jgi:hypothetical protein
MRDAVAHTNKRIDHLKEWMTSLQEGQNRNTAAIQQNSEITKTQLIPQIRKLTEAIKQGSEEQRQNRQMFAEMMQTQALLQRENAELRVAHNHDMEEHEKETSALTKAGIWIGGGAGLVLLTYLAEKLDFEGLFR